MLKIFKKGTCFVFLLSPETFLAKKPNAIFALTLHGGHLGFFEGAVLFPQPLTWMDKVIVGYANAMCQYEKQKPPCQSPCTEGKA